MYGYQGEEGPLAASLSSLDDRRTDQGALCSEGSEVSWSPCTVHVYICVYVEGGEEEGEATQWPLAGN